MNRLLETRRRGRVPLVLQSESAECGLACLAMVCGHHGYLTDLASLRERFSVSQKGVSLAQLVKMANNLDLNARPLRLELQSLRRLSLPAILHWELNHFVVLKHVGRNHIVILDPARGERHYTFDEVSSRFTGVALELAPTRSFAPKVVRRRIDLGKLLGSTRGLGRALAQILMLAGALELFALIAPLFMQLVVDQALVGNDYSLLTVLGIGFLLLNLVQVLVGSARSWVLLYLSTTLNLQLVSNLFRHLVKLPVNYFERRHLGDVVSRFDSLHAIQRTLTSGFLEAVVDGVMIIGTLTVLFVYSARLALVVCGVCLLYAALRLALYRPLHQASEAHIALGARQQSNLLETVRGIQSVKLFNREAYRHAQFENLAVDQFNAGMRVEKLGIGYQALNKLLFGVENIVVVWLGATLVMQGGFSVGMLFAFMAYKSQATSRFARLVEHLIEFRMLSLHAERVADIAVTEPEESEGLAQVPIRRLQPSVEVRHLRVRYSQSEEPVLRDVSFKVRPGESVAIVGASGCGKTTLARAMLGLLPFEHGDVLIGGHSLKRLGAQQYRDFIGTVMQEDRLFAGTIADNVAFFATEIDLRRVETCCMLAAIHDDIVAMPMRYNTLIGDMGTVLSSGQQQRILLARALYKQPSILFLDEATSHLDVDCERRVSEAIRQLAITRIIIAHRPETIASADRVIYMHDGRILAEKPQSERAASTHAATVRLPRPALEVAEVS
ncbi:MAG: peptidase domain-containing ABC transporter [Gammaproteobacteria bacterium]|nr:peptidase domain-containing ABC transporter [Gammaproteobacteria bacterium]